MVHKRNPWKRLVHLTVRQARRLVVGVIGFSVILFGLLLIFIPGPAFVVIPLGLAILATEFVWARRLLKRAKQQAQSWKNQAQSPNNPANKWLCRIDNHCLRILGISFWNGRGISGMELQKLIDSYAEGPVNLKNAVTGMDREKLLTRSEPGRWSPLEVVCHIADFETVYADRMKRVLAEDEPTFSGGDPDSFANRLCYHQRDLEDELAVVESVRRQMHRIFSQLEPQDFERVGHHQVDGPLTLKELLRRITNHIPHHVKFIEQKREALSGSSPS